MSDEHEHVFFGTGLNHGDTQRRFGAQIERLAEFASCDHLEA